MNTNQRFFLLDGLLVIFMIIISFIFYLLNAILIIWLLTLCGMYAMRSYYTYVKILPIVEQIGFYKGKSYILKKLLREKNGSRH